MNGRARTAPAVRLLNDIRDSAQASPELRALSGKKYAVALIEDAPFFLPKELLAWFETREFASEHERALEYLAAMPTSGVRILARTTKSSDGPKAGRSA